MAVPIRFNFKDLADLNEDLKKSPRAASIIVQRVLQRALRGVRREQAGQMTRTGRPALRSTVVKPRGSKGVVVATYGILPGRRVSARAVIVGNVQQKPGAQVRKAAYLWIPTTANKNITPRDFFAAENTFIRTTSGGNRIAFVRNGNDAIPLFILKHNIRLSRPPVPIDQRVETELPVITQEIQDTIAQVIEARKAALSALADG